MFKSIPASNIAAVYPAVLSGGGNPLGLNTNLVTAKALYPSYEFTSAEAVGAQLGTDSLEYKFAEVYFNGYKGASTRPNSLFITAFNDTDVAARLIGGKVTTSLDTLKTYTGSLTVVVDGTSQTGTVNLSTATSFSNAATIIQTALTGTEVVYNPSIGGFIVSTTTEGATSTISFATGTIADSLGLTEAKGATQLNGSAIDTTDSLFARMTAYTENFATITYSDENFPEGFKKEFAQKVSAQQNRYWFVAYDLDPASTVPNNASSFGGWVLENELSGITPIYGTYKEAALACGYAASVNYEEENGRTTLAFRSQDGIAATVTDEQTAEALITNGYSFYGAWATANDRFVMFGNGAVSGDFKWVDNYLFQVFLNSQFQLALVQALRNYKSIPYNADGEAIISAVLKDPINQGLNFGGIRGGVSLTEQQKDIINREIGIGKADQLTSKGWVLSIVMPSAQARSNRESPIIKFFYTDGSSVQRIEMTSTNVQ